MYLIWRKCKKTRFLMFFGGRKRRFFRPKTRKMTKRSLLIARLPRLNTLEIKIAKVLRLIGKSCGKNAFDIGIMRETPPKMTKKRPFFVFFREKRSKKGQKTPLFWGCRENLPTICPLIHRLSKVPRQFSLSALFLTFLPPPPEKVVLQPARK